MTIIVQSALPPEMDATPGLPGVAPLDPADWLRIDDAFAGQMALRETLIDQNRDAVLALLPEGRAAAIDLLDTVLGWLSEQSPDYQIGAGSVLRPDGAEVPILRDDPLGTLGRLVQEDLCLIEKPDGSDEHILTGAVLCFPASWRLAEKIGRPLTAIHDPVTEYDSALARRVQRLFDGVQPDRPLWRFNRLAYADPALFQPVSRMAPDPDGDSATHPFRRAERQTILRLRRSRAVVFAIHSYVVAR